LGPLLSADDEQSDEKKKKNEEESVDASLGLISSGPVNLDQQIDEPVTSGSDIDLGFGPPPGSI
jgi:hypothetical protein